jgi:hypothetical protein
MRCQISLKDFSSSAVTRAQRSMKSGREITRGGCLRSGAFSASGSSERLGSRGRVGSQRTWKRFCTRRSVGTPLSSQPIG